MQFQTFPIQYTNGSAASGVSVFVYLANTVTPATVFDENGNELSLPLVSGARGQVAFAAASGTYDLRATVNGVEVTVENVQFFDRDSVSFRVFTTRAIAQAADTGTASLISVDGLDYVYDASGTALTTGDGRKWSPNGDVSVEHFGVVYGDRSAAAANGAAINEALEYCIANGFTLDFGVGVIFNSVPMVQDGRVDVIQGGQTYWNKNGVATTNIPAGSYVVMTGTGAKDQTVFGISSCQAWGGEIANPTPQAGYNDSNYILSSFITASATADGQTLKPFSAAYTMTKNAEGSKVQLRVIPDGGGDDGMDYYQTGSAAASTALTSGDWDVGLFVQGCKQIDISSQFVGQWRMRMGLLAVPHSDSFPATLYRAKFDDSTFSGLAIRGVDHAPITATTSSTFDIPWADDHPFTTEGTTVRLSSGGRTSSAFTFTSVTRVTDGISAGVDSLRFNGVSPDPTGLTGCMPDYRGGGTSGISFQRTQIVGFGHPSDEPSEKDDLAGSGPYSNPMNVIEISGNEITEVDMSLAELEGGSETVAIYMGDCRHVLMPRFIEMNGDGARIIAWPERSSNPNTAHSSVPATSETMEPIFHQIGSTRLNGSLDLRPYIQDAASPTRFNDVSDDGLFTPIQLDAIRHGIHAYMDVGSIVVAPAGGVSGLGRRVDDGEFLDPTLSDYDMATYYDDSSDTIITEKATFHRSRPYITGVTFVGTGGALYRFEGDRAEFQITDDGAAVIAMSGDCENLIATIVSNANTAEWGIVKCKTDAAPGGAVMAGSTNFTLNAAALGGTTGVDGDLTFGPQQGELRIENREGGNRQFLLKIEAGEGA